MALTIRSTGLDDPYAILVSSFFAQEFPGANSDSKAAVLEAVTTAFISTNQIRFGSVPNPESLVAIRDVYRTLPQIFASTHIPAWRAKGYLRINGDVRPKIASWTEARQYTNRAVWCSPTQRRA